MKAAFASLGAVLLTVSFIGGASAQSAVTPVRHTSYYGGAVGGCDEGCKKSWFGSRSDGCRSDRSGNFLLNWIKKPCPSCAPTIRPQYPLGFPTHPYARSPRDYFMID